MDKASLNAKIEALYRNTKALGLSDIDFMKALHNIGIERVMNYARYDKQYYFHLTVDMYNSIFYIPDDVEYIEEMFPYHLDGDVTILGGRGLKSLRSIFEKMDVKGVLDLTYFEPSKFCDMSKAFYMCSAKNIILGNLNTHNATNMSEMFEFCKTDSIDISNLDFSNVRTIDRAFCISNISYIKLCNTKMPELIDMEHMFDNCRAGKIDFYNIDAPKLEFVRGMFETASFNEINFHDIDMHNVKDVGHMFAFVNTRSIIDLTSFNFSKLTIIDKMFYGAIINNLKITNFNTDKVHDKYCVFCHTKANTFETDNKLLIDCYNHGDTRLIKKINFIG